MPLTKIESHHGSATPLGATATLEGVNFALFSKKKPTLCLYKNSRLAGRFSMKRTGDVWHIALRIFPSGYSYTYEVEGREIIDPFARTIHGDLSPGEKFDWQGSEHPHHPLEKLIIYELHVKSFGKTFKGVEKRIPYLKELGVNAIELMPIFAFDTAHPTKPALCNYWGYNTINFFSLHEPYGSVDDFKSLVRTAHKENIEVYLDVVYNHSASQAFRLLAPDVYFMHDTKGHDLNFSGCGNTINCNHPVVQNLIISSLRYFVEEMHVDGYRFDLATILMRGKRGRPLMHPHLIEAISKDPVLAKTKMIAEPWDPGGLYKLGGFPKKRWMEWNGRYRDQVRQFLKGSDDLISNFATCLCGSQDLFKPPECSINFVTCHDGFSLKDLVSYNEKHNEANGENNLDGENHNNSWNCGFEGETDDRDIEKLRERQIKNFFFTLLFSRGTPMLNMGDEYGHSKKGNNNSWALDSPINWFNWKLESPIRAFVKKAIALRKQYPIGDEIYWHGVKPSSPDWSASSRFIAFERNPLYFAINAYFKPIDIELPEGKWELLIDTHHDHETEVERHYKVEAHSCVLMRKIIPFIKNEGNAG